MRNVLFAFVLVLALPAPATAATVTADPGDEVAEGGVWIDAKGERNDLTVSARGERVAIREHGHAPLVAGEGCVQHGPRRVACEPVSDYTLSLVVNLGARADSLAIYEADSSFLDIEVHGGTGRDSISLTASHRSGAEVFGGDGRDLLRGGAEDDALEGGAGRDRLLGGGGNDSLVGDVSDADASADDVLDGGGGRDTASWEGRRIPIRVDLARGSGGGAGEFDRLRSVEAASGGDRADHLRGDGGANSLYGGPGRDWLDGRGGNDTVDVGGSTVFVSGESDRRADHIRCGPGLDTVTETDKDVLPSDCDLLAGSEAVPLDEDPIHAQPRPRPGGVEVEALCSGYADRCTRTATLRSGGRILGRSATAASTTSERMWLFVPLNRPLPRGRTIVISVAGSDDYEDEEPRSYAAAWRVRR